MLSRQKAFLAAVNELFLRQQQKHPVDVEEFALNMELLELHRKFDRVIGRLAQQGDRPT